MRDPARSCWARKRTERSEKTALDTKKKGKLGDSHFVLAEERQVEQDLDGLGVGSEDDKFCNAAIERLGRLVRTLLQLLVVACLLHEIQDLHKPDVRTGFQ